MSVSNRHALLIFVASLIFISAGTGFAFSTAVHRFHIWPYAHLDVVLDHFQTYLRFGEWAPIGRVVMAPASASRQRVTLHDAVAVAPGYRAIAGWNGELNEHVIWLLNEHGRDLHSWNVNYAALDPHGPLAARDSLHAMAVLRDGSVIVVFDKGNLLARLDACGKSVWKKEGIFHHSLAAADDGSFWTWRGETHAYEARQYLVNFDPRDGHTIAEYNLIEDFLEPSAHAKAIFGIADGFNLRRGFETADQRKDDVFHPNDLEPLPARLADKFPAFRAGDLLVSFRTIELVAVLDPGARAIKWWRYGPWIKQHDPDFEEDGRIWVYSNNFGHDRSTIVAIDPQTDAIETAFTRPEMSFYSAYMGKHQRLPNGTRLIVIPEQGRVVETTRSGEVVFEFNNIHREKSNWRIQNALWLPPDYFDSPPACPVRTTSAN